MTGKITQQRHDSNGMVELDHSFDGDKTNFQSSFFFFIAVSPDEEKIFSDFYSLV